MGAVHLQDIASHVSTISDLINYLVMTLLNVFKSNRKVSNEKYFLSLKTAISAVSRQTFNCVTSFGAVYLDYHSPNVIYIIASRGSFLQYVGKTGQKINEIFDI